MSIVATENFNEHSFKIIEENGDIWFIAVQVAEAIGYRSPKQATYDLIARNPEDFKGLYLSKQIAYPGQRREVILLNEEGVYLFCMLARTEQAIQFRRWVSQFLKTYRHNKLALVGKEFALISQDHNKLKEDYRFISSEYKSLRFDVSLLAREVKRLQDAEEKELNRCITTVEFYKMKKEGWQLANRYAMLQGRAQASDNEKRDLWERMKKDLKISIFFKLELFSVKQYSQALEWIREENKKLDFHGV